MENNSSERPIEQKKIIFWENRKELGPIKAFLLTCKEVIFHPRRFFSQMEFKEKLIGPLSFGTIIFIVLILSYSLVFSLIPTGLYGLGKLASLKKLFTSTWFLLSTPLISFVGLFIATIIFHIGLWLTGARNGFLATFRVVGYSTSTLLISLIPLFIWLLFIISHRIHWLPIVIIIALTTVISVTIGGLLAHIWPLVVLNIGFKNLHKISFSRAIGSTIISLTLGFILFLFVGITPIPLIFQFPERGGICIIEEGALPQQETIQQEVIQQEK